MTDLAIHSSRSDDRRSASPGVRTRSDVHERQFVLKAEAVGEDDGPAHANDQAFLFSSRSGAVGTKSSRLPSRHAIVTPHVMCLDLRLRALRGATAVNTIAV